MKKISVLLMLLFAAGCAAIPREDLARLKTGMTEPEVKDAVGGPLTRGDLFIHREGKLYKPAIKVWEYRNLFQDRETLLYLYGGRLRQIEPDHDRSRTLPAPDFELDAG